MSVSPFSRSSVRVVASALRMSPLKLSGTILTTRAEFHVLRIVVLLAVCTAEPIGVTAGVVSARALMQQNVVCPTRANYEITGAIVRLNLVPVMYLGTSGQRLS